MKKIFIFVIGLFNLCSLPSFGSITINEKQEIPSLKFMAIESIQNHIKKLEQDDREQAIEYAQKINKTPELLEDLKEIIFCPVFINNRSNLEYLSVISYFTRKITIYLDFTTLKNKSFFEPLYYNESLIELSIDIVHNDKITAEDYIDFTRLNKLKNFKLQYFDFEQINFLNCLVNLTRFNLSLSTVKNISALSSLKNLETLILNENEVDDLTPLCFLTQLRYLSLSNNQIKDLTPLSFLKKLQMLILSSNHITDLTPLSFLTELQRLNLGDNIIKDLTPLSSLKNLKLLLLYSNKIKTIEPLKNLKKLRMIDLRYNFLNFCDFEPQLLEKLISFKNLRIFTLTDDKIEGLNFIKIDKPLQHILRNHRVMEFKNPFSTIDFKL